MMNLFWIGNISQSVVENHSDITHNRRTHPEMAESAGLEAFAAFQARAAGIQKQTVDLGHDLIEFLKRNIVWVDVLIDEGRDSPPIKQLCATLSAFDTASTAFEAEFFPFFLTSDTKKLGYLTGNCVTRPLKPTGTSPAALHLAKRLSETEDDLAFAIRMGQWGPAVGCHNS